MSYPVLTSDVTKQTALGDLNTCIITPYDIDRIKKALTGYVHRQLSHTDEWVPRDVVDKMAKILVRAQLKVLWSLIMLKDVPTPQQFHDTTYIPSEHIELTIVYQKRSSTTLEVSFRIGSTVNESATNVAFVIGTVYTGLFADGNLDVALAKITYVTHNKQTVDVVVFVGVGQPFFTHAMTTPFFEVHPMMPDTYTATLPLMNDRLSSTVVVTEILTITR
jgi:hypothetical protein